MQLIHASSPVNVSLQKDLVRSIKSGHKWLFSDAVDLPRLKTGAVGRLVDRSGQAIACGICCPEHPIAMRICRTQPPWKLDEHWMAQQLEIAVSLREQLFDGRTTGYRLVAGEGDGLPGLIIDRYADTAVIKLDGGAPEKFYAPLGIAQWLVERLQLRTVIFRPRGRGTVGECLIGEMPAQPVEFLENGLRFTSDVVHGQKTGFFLDQRDNRALIRSLAKDRTVLNLFSFSGGFSIAAGQGAASQVTSVDIAAPAMRSAELHWQLNALSIDRHQAEIGDCFEFLEAAKASRQRWDVVICDPPSFAPNQQSVERASAAYAKLAQLSASVVEPNGLLALASCSSHINAGLFLRANLQGIGRARRTAYLLAEKGLPADHPTPMAMPELKYLKFQLLRLEG